VVRLQRPEASSSRQAGGGQQAVGAVARSITESCLQACIAGIRCMESRDLLAGHNSRAHPRQNAERALSGGRCFARNPQQLPCKDKNPLSVKDVIDGNKTGQTLQHKTQCLQSRSPRKSGAEAKKVFTRLTPIHPYFLEMSLLLDALQTTPRRRGYPRQSSYSLENTAIRRVSIRQRVE